MQGYIQFDKAPQSNNFFNLIKTLQETVLSPMEKCSSFKTNQLQAEVVTPIKHTF